MARRRSSYTRRLRDDYEVGWGRPPHESRWRPGQSGNPNGRPRGAQGLLSTLHKMMREKIKIVENGKARTISLWEAVGRTLRNKALKGDQKAIELLINLEPLIEDRGAPLPKLGKTSTPEEAAEVYQRLIRSVPLRR